ncbi:MAG: hypothetical protein QXQ39_07145 [Conexivisphaerales archaeon]
MNGHELATILRKRQIENAPMLVKQLGGRLSLQQFISAVKTMSDDKIVEAYITCPHCGHQQTSIKEAFSLAAECKDVDEWFDRLNRIGHGC